jgi:probable F420-dependent oxidoreductase
VPLKSPYPYGADGAPPMSSDWNYPDNFACASAIGAVTTRLKYVTSVFVLGARNPLMVAKAAGTTAILTGHRFILGVAAGWMKEEFDWGGVDFHTRGKRLDEMIEAMRKLWLGGVVEYHGKHIDFDALQIAPAPGRLVPVVIGGGSPAALKRAATIGDGWLNAGNTLEDITRLVGELKRLLKEAGRENQPYSINAAVSTPPDLDTFKRMRDLGVTDTLAYPPRFVLGPTSTLAQKKAMMESFAEKFVRHF